MRFDSTYCTPERVKMAVSLLDCLGYAKVVFLAKTVSNLSCDCAEEPYRESLEFDFAFAAWYYEAFYLDLYCDLED